MDPVTAILVGFGLLVMGGELLVRGAVRAAQCFGISPLMIGIVLVGFGTSAPEMAISVYAALQASPGIAVGNIVGSSISNILLILGLSAMIMPIAVSSKALSRDGVVVLASAVGFAMLGLVHPLDRPIGALFLVGLVGYLTYAWRQERTSPSQDLTSAQIRAEAQDQLRHVNFSARLVAGVRAGMPLGVALVMATAGLAVLIFGGQVLVDGAVALARSYDVSEEVIGLTIVAVGTSMPELVTSLVAALRRQPAVAVGNILGSNIYNVLGVGGLTGLLAPTVVPEQIAMFDNFVMVAAGIALMFFAWSGMRISRLEGATLFVAYGVYLWSLLPANLTAG